MPTQANAEHDPQHIQESTTPQHETSTFPGREKTQTKEKKAERSIKFTSKDTKEGKADESIIAGMKVVGKSRLSYGSIIRHRYNRYLVTGTVSQWQKLLSQVDTHHKFDRYVTPFLAAAGASPYGIEKKSFSIRENEIFLVDGNSKIGEHDILNFLLALYDVNPTTPSQIDFPNKPREQDSNTNFINRYSDGLAKFIELHQHKLITHMSKKGHTGTKSILSPDVSRLADQGTRWASTDHKVKRALMQNAICSAFVGAGRVLNAQMAFDSPENEKKIGLKMVKNSARIIKGVLNQKSTGITDLETQIGATLGVVWGLIPVAKPIRLLFEIYKASAFTKLTKSFKIGGDMNKVDAYRERLGDAFEDVLDKTFDLEQAKLYSKEHGINIAISSEKDANWYVHLSREFRENI